MLAGGGHNSDITLTQLHTDSSQLTMCSYGIRYFIFSLHFFPMSADTPHT